MSSTKQGSCAPLHWVYTLLVTLILQSTYISTCLNNTRSSLHNNPFVNGLYTLVLYNNTHIVCVCVCLCLSVCPTWDIQNTRPYHHAAYTILKSFTWWVVQTALLAYTIRGLREKAFGSFHQLHAESCAHSVTLPVNLGRMNLAQYKKAIGTFSKGMCWRTQPPDHGYYSCYCFWRKWAIDTP